MKSSITNRQIFFLLFLTLTAYSIISMPNVIAKDVGTGGWIPLMITSLFFAVFAMVIIRLNSAFPGMMLSEYAQRIVGKFLAAVITVYFFLYFVLIIIFLAMKLTTILQVEFYPKTPRWATLIVSIIVAGCVAHHGVVSVGRFFEVIGTVYLITAIATHITMLQQGDLSEIRPFFRASQLSKYLMGTKDTLLAFLGVELLMIFPLSGKKIKKTIATASLGIIFIGLFYVFLVETSIMILGMNSAQNYHFALIEAVKQVDNVIVERLDFLYLTIGFSGLVAGICGIYLALVELAIRLLPKVKRFFVVGGVGALIIALGIAAQIIKPEEDIYQLVISVMGLCSAFFIPTSLLLIAKVRGLVQKSQ